jgi:hypothetical protein
MFQQGALQAGKPELHWRLQSCAPPYKEGYVEPPDQYPSSLDSAANHQMTNTTMQILQESLGQAVSMKGVLRELTVRSRLNIQRNRLFHEVRSCRAEQDFT